jgi:hypothetical protein
VARWPPLPPRGGRHSLPRLRDGRVATPVGLGWLVGHPRGHLGWPRDHPQAWGGCAGHPQARGGSPATPLAYGVASRPRVSSSHWLHKNYLLCNLPTQDAFFLICNEMSYHSLSGLTFVQPPHISYSGCGIYFSNRLRVNLKL